MKRLLTLLYMAIIVLSATALQPQRGYRGFIDSDNFLGINPGFLTGDGGESTIYTGFTTSHGYQFNNWLYAGAGAGFVYNLSWNKYSYHHDDGRWVIPVFTEVRMDASWGRFTPYFSAQLGANAGDHGGIYFSPMVGYRFNWGRKSAINFGLGATIYSKKIWYYDPILQPDGGFINGPRVNYHGTFVKFTARLGFEFQLPKVRCCR